MIYSHDETADAGYIKFSENKVAKTVPVNENIFCDLDKNGMLCGVEILGVKKEELVQWSKNIGKADFMFS